jgi:hypothetical protein
MVARGDNEYDPTTNPTDVFYQYQPEAILQEQVTILPIVGSSEITTIEGDGGGTVTGPTVEASGGVTGYQFVASGVSFTLTVSNAATIRSSLGLGTIATVNSPVPIANGGTAGTTAAAARTNLEVPRMTIAVVPPAVTDDGVNGWNTGSLWVDTNTGVAYISVDDTTGSAIWIDITA